MTASAAGYYVTWSKNTTFVVREVNIVVSSSPRARISGYNIMRQETIKTFSPMSKNYLISVVAPIYGVEKYIEKFARSVLSQDCADVQYVFVDDGSKDRSVDLLNAIIDNEFPHLKEDIVLVRKPNGGLPLARKTGMEHACGEYILHADSDDWMAAGALSKIADKIRETGADIVYFDFVKEYAHRVSYKRERDYDVSTKDDYIINIFNYKSHGYAWSKCFRRSIWTDNVIYTPICAMHEDIYLMSQIIFHARSFAHIKEPLYHYRKDNASSICSQNKVKLHIQSDRNMFDLYEHFKDNLKDSPIEHVWGGMLMRAGMHALVYRQEFFTEYPYLADDIFKAPLSFRYRLNMPGQIYLKLYTGLRLLCRRGRASKE